MKKRSILRKFKMIGLYNIVRKGPGKGTFGEIYQVSHPDNKGEIYALKKIKLESCSEKDKEHCRSEAQQLQRANHKHIVGFIDSFQKDNALCIVMEFCKGGTLRDYIQRYTGIIKEEQFLVLFIQICEGLKYLHDKGIAHRDVKTTNILLTENDTIKIADLGLAKVLEKPKKNTEKVGSPYVMSPEMFEGQEYTLKTDIWSLGCCMYEIGTKTNIFKCNNIHSLREQHRSTEKIFEIAKQLPYCTALQSQFCAMLQPIQDIRPSVGDILADLKGHSKTHIGAQTTPTPIQEPRRKTKQAVGMNKTCPAKIDISSLISQHDSGIDTEASETHEIPEGATGGCPVTVEVEMNEEQKEFFDSVNNLERLILGKLSQSKGLLNEIRNQIKETKSEETHDKFLAMVKKTLGESLFKKCRVHLISLWLYKTDLLNANFQMI